MANYIDASEAARRLGVSRQSLYAYVSRGLIKAVPADDPRQSRYLAAAVDQLAQTRRRGRKPREIARATLDWGMPVLESGLTLIEDGRCYYRGQDAVQLSHTASLEEVAALLWKNPVKAAFPRRAPMKLKAYDSLTGQAGSTPASETLLPLFAVAARDDATSAWRTDTDGLARGCGDLVRLLTAAALSGVKHGAVTTRVERLWDALDPLDPGKGLRQRLKAGEDIPGFGHPLYPDGDIRARALLATILPAFEPAARFAGEVKQLTGEDPSIDFALVALRRYLALPEGSAFLLFAIGRSTGWIAHGLEQRTTNQLIRPRALYTGERP